MISQRAHYGRQSLLECGAPATVLCQGTASRSLSPSSLWEQATLVPKQSHKGPCQPKCFPAAKYCTSFKVHPLLMWSHQWFPSKCSFPLPGFICPANNYYDFCGTACPASCAKLNAPAHCTKPCVAGCFCREGYVLNTGTCVPLSQCGCTLNGRYYQLGAEVILTDVCSKKCACRRPARTMECQEHACGVLEMCKVVDERRGCYPMTFGTMWAYGHSHYVTYDGVVFDHQGACRYTLSTYCGPPGKLPGFTVKVLKAHHGSIAVTWPRLVKLKVYGQHITMAAGQDGKIQVRIVQQSLLEMTLSF